MELTVGQRQRNQKRFLALLNSVNRKGMRKEELINKLINSDFFRAPASTKYHCNVTGGLCQHSLNVYDCLKKICSVMYPVVEQKSISEDGTEIVKQVCICPYSEDTIIIVSLLHDFSKMNYYKQEDRNVKKYYQGGSKTDSGGEYDWVLEPHFVVAPAEDRFIFGNHEENSYYMTSAFVPLTAEEGAAILNHHSGQGENLGWEGNNEISTVMEKYPLATLLHMADYLSTFFVERDIND